MVACTAGIFLGVLFRIKIIQEEAAILDFQTMESWSKSKGVGKGMTHAHPSVTFYFPECPCS